MVTVIMLTLFSRECILSIFPESYVHQIFIAHTVLMLVPNLNLKKLLKVKGELASIV